MNRNTMLCFLTLLAIALSVPAWAVNVTISGKFVVSGPQMPWIDSLQFCGNEPTLYEVVGPFSTDVGGTYRVRDAGRLLSGDTVVTFYQGMPNLNNLAANRVAVADDFGFPGAIDDSGTVVLQANTDYYLLAQPYCSIDSNGVWGLLLLGSGTITGSQVATTPAHWQGTWSDTDDLTDTIPPTLNCPETYYDVNGPITLETSGIWYVSTTSAFEGNPMAVSFHDGPFDPDNPQQNQVAVAPGGLFELEAGDYYIVTHGDCDILQGEWSYVMWPPHPFELNGAMSAAYRDPDTSGSGVLLDVDPSLNFAFGAWFTWATAPAADSTTPQAVGNDRQRWLTLQGAYQPGDTSVEMTVYSSSGGVFDDPAEVETVAVGTATLDMEDCTTGTLTYTLDSGESGDSVMGRLLPGNIGACESSYLGPGVLYE